MPNIIEAIRKGHMKEIAPRKFSDTQKSGSFKLWAKEVKDIMFIGTIGPPVKPSITLRISGASTTSSPTRLPSSA